MPSRKTPGVLSPAQLVDHAGRLMFGLEYRRPLAQRLGVNPRTVERVAAAASEGRDYPAARAMAHDVRQLLQDHASEAADLAAEAARTIAAHDIKA